MVDGSTDGTEAALRRMSVSLAAAGARAAELGRRGRAQRGRARGARRAAAVPRRRHGGRPAPAHRPRAGPPCRCRRRARRSPATSGHALERPYRGRRNGRWSAGAGWPRCAEIPLDELLTGQISLSREAFEAVGGFDTAFTRQGMFGGEDIDFGYRLRLAGYRIVFDETAVSYQRFDRRSGPLPSPCARRRPRRCRADGKAPRATARAHPTDTAPAGTPALPHGRARCRASGGVGSAAGGGERAGAAGRARPARARSLLRPVPGRAGARRPHGDAGAVARPRPGARLPRRGGPLGRPRALGLRGAAAPARRPARRSGPARVRLRVARGRPNCVRWRDAAPRARRPSDVRRRVRPPAHCRAAAAEPSAASRRSFSRSRACSAGRTSGTAGSAPVGWAYSTKLGLPT